MKRSISTIIILIITLLLLLLIIIIIIIIHIIVINRKEPVRFDSFRFRTFQTFIGSVRFGLGTYFPGSTRFGLRFSGASWFGLVRFRSFPHPVPAGSGINRFGSVRFGRFASVSYFFLERAGCGPEPSASVPTRPLWVVWHE